MNINFCLNLERFFLTSICYLNGYCLKMLITWSAGECLRLGDTGIFLPNYKYFFFLKNVPKAC